MGNSKNFKKVGSKNNPSPGQINDNKGAEKVSETLQDIAENLMIESRVEEIYRTSDAYWFTDRVAADDHARKIGSEKQVFNLKK